MIIELLKGKYSASEAVTLFLAITLAFLIALSFHEYAHAYVATKQGDETPRLKGRLTLNPFAHIDIMGFACFLFVGFGWARPVEINPLNFKKFRSGIAKVSLAGVTANLILCFIFSALYILLQKFYSPGWFSDFILLFTMYGASVNAWLIFLNILPIYPLDGFNWLSTKLKAGNKFIAFNYKYGQLILIILILSQAMVYYISFFSNLLLLPFFKLFSWMFGL